MVHQPVVGVSAGEQDASWGTDWRARTVLLRIDYIRMVEAANGIPVVLPTLSADDDDGQLEHSAEGLVSSIDALVLTGGGDVDPARYGAVAHPQTSTSAAARDSTELALIRAAERRDIPVLAVCRGAQVLNVLRGGTLHQHLPDIVASSDHAPVRGGYGRHRIRVSAAGVLATALDASLSGSPDRCLDVPTNHHQAVADIGRGLVATAWADDGTIEAVEDPAKRFLVGVQWHPEAGDDPSLFRALVKAAESAA